MNDLRFAVGRLLKKPGFAAIAVMSLGAAAAAADYNLGELAKAGKIEFFNRALDPTKAGSSSAVYLNGAQQDGLAWIRGVEFSEGTIELEIKGKNQPGQSFVGIAFHGQDNQAFDAVYLRPFNFHAQVQENRSHSIQYISMPGHDWRELRNTHPGQYEFGLTPAPDPDSWVKLKLIVTEKNVAAYVNGSEARALTIGLLNERLKGKVALWVGNGSDGWFRNLKIIPASK